jgi:hypothetical protein
LPLQIVGNAEYHGPVFNSAAYRNVDAFGLGTRIAA